MDIGVCQNAPLDKEPIKEIDNATILKMYQSNPITKAIVIGGKEPLMQWQEVMDLIKYFRDREEHCPFVIYTGYNADEIPYGLDWLRMYDNTIVKFGRYIINQKPHYDEVLGVWLASDNQYAEVIS